MVKALQITSRGNVAGTQGTTAAGQSQYWWLGQASAPGNTVQANREFPWGVAGTISKLYVKILTNTTSLQSAIIVRKNGADTALLVIIPVGTSGIFEDTTNTVSIAPTDKTTYRSSSGGTGTFQFSVLSCIFDATTNCVSKLVSYPFGITTASTSLYLPVAGAVAGITTVEATCEHTIKVAGIAKNAYLSVFSNARVNDTTFILRKNRVDTAISLNVPAGATGPYTDTTNQISYSVDDEIDWRIATGSGAQTLNMGCLALEYETTGETFIDGGTMGTSDLTIGPSVTEYYTLGGGLMEGISSESDAQVVTRLDTRLKLLTVYARLNTLTATSTVTLRKNGADATQTVSIASGATGYFVDTTNIDIVDPDDTVDYKVVTGGTGTLLTISQMAIWGAINAVQKTLSQTESIGESGTRNKAAWRLQP